MRPEKPIAQSETDDTAKRRCCVESFQLLNNGTVSKTSTDPYQPTASCPPNHSRCDNRIIRLLWSFHLIEKLHFLLSRAQFNSTELPPFPSLTSAPQLWSYLYSSARETGEITQSQLPVMIHWLKASCESWWLQCTSSLISSAHLNLSNTVVNNEQQRYKQDTKKDTSHLGLSTCIRFVLN